MEKTILRFTLDRDEIVKAIIASDMSFDFSEEELRNTPELKSIGFYFLNVNGELRQKHLSNEESLLDVLDLIKNKDVLEHSGKKGITLNLIDHFIFHDLEVFITYKRSTDSIIDRALKTELKKAGNKVFKAQEDILEHNNSGYNQDIEYLKKLQTNLDYYIIEFNDVMNLIKERHPDLYISTDLYNVILGNPIVFEELKWDENGYPIEEIVSLEKYVHYVMQQQD